MNLEELGIPYTDMGDQKEIQLFWHISQSLVSKQNIEDILQLIVTMTASVMRSKICSLMLLDDAKQELAIKATQALSARYINKPPVKIGESVSGRAVKDRQPVMVRNVLEEKSYGFPDIAKTEGIVSMMSVPMIVGERVIGVINTYTTEPHDFSETETKILQTVANQAALAIENATLRKEASEAQEALEEEKLIAKAKSYLVSKDGIKDSEATDLILKTSRENRKSPREVASAIILVYSAIAHSG